jgi:DNA-binding NtrC family response regulator
VLLLAGHFLEKFSREFKKPGLELSEEARERLLQYRWPGNVRELQNTMERAVILTDGLSITADGRKP